MSQEKWQTVPIETVIHGLYDGPHATPKPADEGPIFLGIRNITDDGRLDFSEIRHISEAEFPRWTKRVTPQAGDIVFTYEATLNRYAIIPEGFRGCLGRRIALLRPNNSKVDTRYLHYYFFGEEWRHTIRKNMLSGSTVDRIPLTDFPEFEITLPPLPTQRKIAAILSAYDDLIENNQRRIAILEEMAQLIYREWFVHFRYPGHEDVPLVDSPLGPIPEGWEVHNILDVADVQYGYAFKSKLFTDGPDGIPVIRIRNVRTNSTATYTTEVADDKYLVQNGDILVGMDGDFHMCIWSGPKSYLVQRVARFRPRMDLPQYFLFHALTAPIDYFNRTITGTTVAHLGHKHIKTIQLVIPRKQLLTKCRDILDPILEMVLNLHKKNEHLRVTRDLLLPRLVSGEIDASMSDKLEPVEK